MTQEQLALTYFREGTAALQYDKQRGDINKDDLVAALFNERREERAWVIEQFKMIRQTTLDWVAAIRDREAALSQEADRAPARELAKIKAEVLRGTFYMGKNILTNAFGKYLSEKQTAMVPGGGGENVPGGNGTNPIVETRMTEERRLIDNFLQDCKTAKIELPLFGDWGKGPDNKPMCTKKGIFDPEQFLIMAKVLTGHLTADALDDLLPDSGKPAAIRLDQMAQAQALEGMNEGIASTIVTLLTLREGKRAQKQAEAASATANVTAATPTPTPPATAPEAPNEKPAAETTAVNEEKPTINMENDDV